MEKRDKLGRIIPVYDRSAAGKKAAEKIRREKGEDYFGRIGALGGSRTGRGYFGALKDQGKTDELKRLSKEALEAKLNKSKLHKEDN